MTALKRDYEYEKMLEYEYDEAERNNNETAMDEIRAKHEKFEDELKRTGEPYCLVYRLYCEAKKSGNELIDVNEPYDYRNAERLIAAFDLYGIKQFTFSSTCSGAVEAAWKFNELGYKLEGMVEINSKYSPSFRKKERDKVHAYLFKVD